MSLLFVVACNHPPPTEELLRSAAPAISWVAALQLAAEKWETNSVPDSYLRNAAKAADQTFDAAQQATAASAAPSDLRRRLRAACDAARSDAALLRHGAAVHDRSVAPRAIANLRALNTELRNLQQQYGASQ